MVVNPAVPAKTVPEFIAYAKDNLGKIAMASAGTGSAPHVAGELFKASTAVNMLHVPYRGDAPPSPICWRASSGLFQHPARIDRVHKGRKLRALAVTTAARSEALPDIPSLS